MAEPKLSCIVDDAAASRDGALFDRLKSRAASNRSRYLEQEHRRPTRAKLPDHEVRFVHVT